MKRLILMSIALFAGLASADPAANSATDGKGPRIFAEGVISTGREFALTFAPDMHEAYFTRGVPDKKINHIMRTELRDGQWQEATAISFTSDEWSDLDPALSPNGQRLFFISTRPSPDPRNPVTGDMNIWYVDRAMDGWGQPQYLHGVNSARKEGSPTVSSDGTLCFFSDRDREPNSNSIYCSEWRQGKYLEPRKLGPEINSEASDTSPSLSVDGRTLLFYSTRPSGYGQADLYVSFRQGHQWSRAVNLGPLVNTEEWEYNPTMSPDRKELYFGRKRNIYRISLDLLHIPGLSPRHRAR